MKIIVLLSFVLLSACATLFSNSEDAITFTSEPAGAMVYLNGVEIGRTPLSYNVDRSTFKQTEVVVKTDGHESKTFMLGRTLAVSAIFNLTCWPSWLTDATSGNMIEYSPRAYFIDLRKAKSSQAEINRTYFVMINHKALLNDLSRGEGEFLKTYLELSNLSQEKKLLLKSVMMKNSMKLLSFPWPDQIYRELEIEIKTI
ncbi:MAG: PEGA domain-containing protein [Bacteriovoracaceae bacterium]